VIKGAPASFALAVIFSCIPMGLLIWKGVDAIYSERISILQVTIQSKDERISKLSTQKIDSISPSARDPDGIYQLGKQVGTVEVPEVDESKSTISFHRIVGAVNFNPNQDFEYRDYILHIRGISAETRGDFSGQRTRALWDARTDIVARR
jgi:hypothetical protein